MDRTENDGNAASPRKYDHWLGELYVRLGEAKEHDAEATSALAVHARSAQAEAERRQLTVMFCDLVGSTEFIIKTIEAAPAGSSWAIGTELNLVKRLADAHPDKKIAFLEKTVCFCSTMNRIDLPHLVWTLESLLAGNEVNVIEVEAETARLAHIALQRMLDLPGRSHRD